MTRSAAWSDAIVGFLFAAIFLAFASGIIDVFEYRAEQAAAWLCSLDSSDLAIDEDPDPAPLVFVGPVQVDPDDISVISYRAVPAMLCALGGGEAGAPEGGRSHIASLMDMRRCRMTTTGTGAPVSPH